MRTRPIDASRATRRIGPAAAVMLVAALLACNAVQAQELRPGAALPVAAVRAIDPTGLAEAATPPRPAGALQSADITDDQAIVSVTASEPFAQSEPWNGFRDSVAGAATAGCFDADALPQEGFAAQGLLRLPLLAHAAATGACR